MFLNNYSFIFYLVYGGNGMTVNRLTMQQGNLYSNYDYIPNYYTTSSIKNYDFKNSKLNAPQYDTVSFTGKNNNEFDYSIDDGKISFGDKIKNFAKGLISPVTNMFSSPKNFLIGAGMIAAGAALTIATGGAIAPLFVAAGVTGGAIQLGTSIYKAHNAKTDEEARMAWQGMGAGTTAVGLSVIGAKSALKGAGVNTEGMNPLSATVECFKQSPKALSKTVNMFTSGEAAANLGLKTAKAKIREEALERVKQETQAEQKAELAQKEYNRQFEENLSNKSAQESAQVFSEEYNTQINKAVTTANEANSAYSEANSLYGKIEGIVKSNRELIMENASYEGTKIKIDGIEYIAKLEKYKIYDGLNGTQEMTRTILESPADNWSATLNKNFYDEYLVTNINTGDSAIFTDYLYDNKPRQITRILKGVVEGDKTTSASAVYDYNSTGIQKAHLNAKFTTKHIESGHMPKTWENWYSFSKDYNDALQIDLIDTRTNNGLRNFLQMDDEVTFYGYNQ